MTVWGGIHTWTNWDNLLPPKEEEEEEEEVVGRGQIVGQGNKIGHLHALSHPPFFIFLTHAYTPIPSGYEGPLSHIITFLFLYVFPTEMNIQLSRES